MADTNSTYFQALDTALKNYKQATPTLVLDINRLNHNLDYLKSKLPVNSQFRLVAKSLPSSKLIGFCCNRLQTKKLMTFGLSMLQDLANENKDYQQMLGKPMPVAAAQKFLNENGDTENILWLIDTHERLREYKELAISNGYTLKIVLELDVGLRRGGFNSDKELQEALKTLKRSNNLAMGGLMGYDAHVPKIPTLAGLQTKEQTAVVRRYHKAIKMVSDILGKEVASTMIRNGAGSPTIHNYQDTNIVNEFAAGSVLVKPSDFDLPKLSPYQAAAFIASPALKVIESPPAPGLEKLSPLLRLLRILPPKTVFLYGGKWMANPVYPDSLHYYNVMGRSSNQEALRGPSHLAIKPDDFVFLRPTQSEFVLLQFGEILIYDNGVITDRWAVYPVHG